MLEQPKLQHLRLKIEAGMAVITIDRPPVNALSQEVLAQIRTALAWLNGNPLCGVLVITGAGEKAFVAGADILGLQDLDPVRGQKFNEDFQTTFDQVENFTQPVICAINGLALGAGCEMALACDFRLAAAQAVFGLPETALGVIPGGGGTQRLPRLIPLGRAKRMIYSGERVDAAEALRLGLVDQVVEQQEDLLPEALRWSRRLLERGPIAIRQAKRAINRGLNLPLQQGLAVEAAEGAACYDTEDFQEGIAAFLNKRKPVFQGR